MEGFFQEMRDMCRDFVVSVPVEKKIRKRPQKGFLKYYHEHKALMHIKYPDL
jgi:hypothetical protein